MCRVQNGIEYLNERIFFFLLQSLPSLKIAVSCCQTLKKGKKVKKTIGNVRFFSVFFSLVSSKSLATRCVPNWQSLSSEWWWQPFCYSRRRWIINLKAIDNLKVWTGEKKSQDESQEYKTVELANLINVVRQPRRLFFFFVVCCVRSAAQHGENMPIIPLSSHSYWAWQLLHSCPARRKSI